MSSVMRQDPWGVMPRLQEEINRLFGNTRENDSSSATANWVPPVDIHEYANRSDCQAARGARRLATGKPPPSRRKCFVGRVVPASTARRTESVSGLPQLNRSQRCCDR